MSEKQYKKLKQLAHAFLTVPSLKTSDGQKLTPIQWLRPSGSGDQILGLNSETGKMQEPSGFLGIIPAQNPSSGSSISDQFDALQFNAANGFSIIRSFFNSEMLERALSGLDEIIQNATKAEHNDLAHVLQGIRNNIEFGRSSCSGEGDKHIEQAPSEILTVKAWMLDEYDDDVRREYHQDLNEVKCYLEELSFRNLITNETLPKHKPWPEEDDYDRDAYLQNFLQRTIKIIAEGRVSAENASSVKIVLEEACQVRLLDIYDRVFAPLVERDDIKEAERKSIMGKTIFDKIWDAVFEISDIFNGVPHEFWPKETVLHQLGRPIPDRKILTQTVN